MATLTPPDDGRYSPSHRDSVASDTAFDVGEAKVQMSGMLMKKPFDRKKTSKSKWQKRLASVYVCFHYLKHPFIL